jgi:AbrB family looped-hinge helix DNA binding protein
MRECGRVEIPFLYGKMVVMNATAEIDKSGRLVVPKKVRDALHVQAGDRFLVEEKEDGIFLRPIYPEVRLEERDGLMVMVGGPPATYDSVELINEQRERRMRYVSGLADEP